MADAPRGGRAGDDLLAPHGLDDDGRRPPLAAVALGRGRLPARGVRTTRWSLRRSPRSATADDTVGCAPPAARAAAWTDRTPSPPRACW
ncbi:MAG: hypothetical protein ACK559_25675, partial [bacterium]